MHVRERPGLHLPSVDDATNTRAGKRRGLLKKISWDRRREGSDIRPGIRSEEHDCKKGESTQTEMAKY